MNDEYGKSLDRVYAMKVLDKKLEHESWDSSQTLQNMAASIEHPFLNQVGFIFETDRKLLIFTEAYEKGHIIQHIAQVNDFKQRQELARFYVL